MSRILRSATVLKENKSNTDEIDYSSDSDRNSVSSDEYDDLEVDESTYDDELMPSDFDSDQNSDSDEEMSQDEYHNSDGSFIWRRSPPDLTELTIIRSTQFSSGLLFPVLKCVELAGQRNS